MGIEIRPATLADRPAICHLISLAFDAEGYGASLANPCISVGSSHLDPHDRPENTRILLVNRQIVGVVHVGERQAYARGDLVPFAVIAAVATHPQHRRRGYMRRLMRDAHAYMQQRGFCYAVLFGRFSTYGGSLGWRWCGEKAPTLAWKYVVSARRARDSRLRTRAATESDIPFLSRVYAARYANRFGPVVRSDEYWRRWSLQCHWEGTYLAVCDGALPVGYFHAHGVDVDEIGWAQPREAMGEKVFLAAASRAAGQGLSRVGFWLDEDDDLAAAALRRAFGDVARVFTDPEGRPVDDSDPAPYRPETRPHGVGYMAKFLNGRPGILARVDSTDALTEVMARHSWTYFDGDAM